MKKPTYNFSKDNPYNTFGTNEFINANTGKEQKIVNEDWRTISQKGGVAFSHPEIEKDSTWNKYLQYLPDVLMLDYLTEEQWGNENNLVERFFKKQILINKCYLASLPEETLKLLVSSYHSGLDESTL